MNDTTEHGPRGRRGIIAVAAILSVFLVVAAAIAAVALLKDDSTNEPADGGDTAAPGAEAPATPGASGEGSGAAGTTADLLGREITVVGDPAGSPVAQSGERGSFPQGGELVARPAGYQLQRLPSGVTVAVSSSDGPTSVTDGAMTGYAHSPQGAGLIAVNYTGFGMSQSQATKDFMTSIVPDEQRAAARAAKGYGPEEEARTRQYLADGYVAPQRIRFRECSESFCTVEVANPSIAEAAGEIDADTDPTMHTVTSVSMKWSGDRWAVLDTRGSQLRDFDDTWGTW